MEQEISANAQETRESL